MRSRRPVGVLYWILFAACGLGLAYLALCGFSFLTWRVPSALATALLCGSLGLGFALLANTFWGLQHARRLSEGESLRPLTRRMWAGLLLSVVLAAGIGGPAYLFISRMERRLAVQEETRGRSRSRDGIPGLILKVTDCGAGADGTLDLSFTLCPTDASDNPHRGWTSMTVRSVNLDQEGLMEPGRFRQLVLTSVSSVSMGSADVYPFRARGKWDPGTDWSVTLGVTVQFAMPDERRSGCSVYLNPLSIQAVP